MLSVYLLNLFLNQNVLVEYSILLDNHLFNSQPIELIASSKSQPNLPVIVPSAETNHGIVMDNDSDADDPAIYIHPQDPAKSLIIATLKNGGMGVYDLTAKEIQAITPKDIRYNNVDIAYGVEYQSQIRGEKIKVDLAIASDRKNDTLAIFVINAGEGNNLESSEFPLQEVTAIDIPESIFGVDDGEATAYGLTAYTNRENGKAYVFVSQSDGNKIAQLELQPRFGAADNLEVNAKLVRILELPIPPGLKRKKTLVEGMVVDKDTGTLYLAQENFGIWQGNADPNLDLNLTLIDRVKDYRPDSPLVADIEGLTIYYGNNQEKYLIASSQGNNTFVIYDLINNNSYWGNFAIEGVEQTDGLDVTSVSLGEIYPQGFLVVQDGVNQPQPNFKFVNIAEIFSLTK